MTDQRISHLDRVMNWLERLIRPKYVKGQQEHGGNMWEKAGMLRNLKDEVADLNVYVQTIEEQLEERFPEAHAFLMGEEQVVPKTATSEWAEEIKELEDVL